jgi:hypothetical protein
MSADAPLRKTIPLAQSILWSPTPTPGTGGGGRAGGRPGNIPFPVFVAQSALAAVREHLATAPPPGQGILGFLVGDLCECPDTNVSYLVIDAALRLSQPIYGDRTTDVVTRIWDRIASQVEETKGHLIGWYHTHAPLPVSMSAHDIETHEHYFAEPWQVALVLGSDADGHPAAGFFRGGSDEVWATTLLPFYELLSEESFRPGGKKRSFVAWKNYRAYNPLADRPFRTPPKQAEPEPAPPEPPVPEAEAPEPEPEEHTPPPEPPPQPPPPTAQEPKSDELVFLTSAEDFASAPPRSARPAQRPTPPPPPPLPPPRQRREPSPEPLPPGPELASIFEEREGEGEGDGDEHQATEQWPEPAVEEEPAPPVRPSRAAGGRRARRIRWGRWGLVFAILLIGSAGSFYVWLNGLPVLPSLPRLPTIPFLKKPQTSVPSRPRPRPRRSVPTPPPPAAKPQATPPAAPVAASRAPVTPLDQVADSLATAVRSFNDRAALFDRRQSTCDGLGRGLLAVEARWLSYSTARRASGILDPTHTGRDQTLYARVDSVEHRFEKSGCQRP